MTLKYETLDRFDLSSIKDAKIIQVREKTGKPVWVMQLKSYDNETFSENLSLAVMAHLAEIVGTIKNNRYLTYENLWRDYVMKSMGASMSLLDYSKLRIEEEHHEYMQTKKRKGHW